MKRLENSVIQPFTGDGYHLITILGSDIFCVWGWHGG